MDAADELVAHLRELEEDLMLPAIRSSRVELEARLAPDFVEFGGSGQVYDRASIIAALAVEGGDDPPVIRVGRFSVRLLAPGVALTTYRSEREDAAGGPPSVTLRSSIWRRDGDAWRLAFHQGTPAR